jgi:hypothetical protein
VLRAALERSWLALAIGTVIVAASFYATGGLDLASATATEMLLTLASGVLLVAATMQHGVLRARLWGLGGVAALLLLAAFTAISVTWSVEPSDSWVEASRTFGYAAAFAGAVALVRLAPGRWRSVISGVLLATLAMAAYALGTKIFPAGGPSFARLNAPFNYWNFVGVVAALGVPPALWVGSRRDGHGAVAALAPPAICLLLVTLMLAYSRGSVLALVIGLAFWFVVTPLRLRSASMLAIGAAGAAIVVAWTLAQTALTTDNEPLAARLGPGHELGWLLLVVMLVCAAGGLALRFATVRNPPSAELRRRIGKALVIGVALIPIVAVIGLTASSRGLFGSISHGVSTLTNTNIGVPNSANRLTALGSQRALYWSNAIKAFDNDPVAGSGAGSFQTTFLRYDKTSNSTVTQAHSYIFQTLTDLGVLGLLLSLMVAAAWVIAARRTVGPVRARDGAAGSSSAERIGLLTMITCVVIAATHSAIDWTWFVPGVMIVALLLAGWVAGRGPHESVLPLHRPDRRTLRDGIVGPVAAAVAILALLLAWSEWQPLRSSDASNSADSAIYAARYHSRSPAAAHADYVAAVADARSAESENPLDYQPLVWLADAQAGLHPKDLRIAYATMVRAVRLQPSNYQTWYWLAQFDYNELDAARAALTALDRALYLYPNNPAALSFYSSLLPVATAKPRAVKPAKHHASSKH